MYLGFVREHPSLFRIAFQRIVPGFDLSREPAEVRGGTLRREPGVDAETVWRDAFRTVVRGFRPG